MRFPKLLNYRSNETSNDRRSPGPNRRNFLKTLGIVGVGLAVAPTEVLADPVKNFLNPTSNAAWLAYCESWRGCVKRFVAAASSNQSLVARIHRQLDASDFEEAPNYEGFHYLFASGLAFSVKIGREELICRNGFLVDEFPYYGVDCTCPSDHDLNHYEIDRLIKPVEVDFYGCVLAPAGSRRRTTESDHSDYESLRAKHYKNHKPEDWKLRYKRRLYSANNGKHYMGYGIEHTSKDANDMLITADTV